MTDAIDINSQRPHTAGEMLCTVCKAEWMGVVPTGTAIVECPECGMLKGMRKQYVVPGENHATFCCLKCGDEASGYNDVFTITQEFAMCCNCGHHHSWMDIWGDG